MKKMKLSHTEMEWTERGARSRGDVGDNGKYELQLEGGGRKLARSELAWDR